MAQRPPRLGLLAACLLLGGNLAPVWSASQEVTQMLTYRPRMEDVNCTIPSAEEQNLCKMEQHKNAQGKVYIWSLVDGRKQTLRRYLDTNSDGRIDVWCYYKDGHEIYREIDSNANNKADQFRWFNEGGMRWGVDTNEDGRIDNWRMISAEEVGQEIFRGLATRDFERLRPLFITEGEMRALKLSPRETERVKNQLAKAGAKFKDTLDKAKVDARAQFVRVESAPPNCIPGDSVGMENDLIHFPSRAILFEVAGKHDWVHSGEMIQVGLSWRLADAPGEIADINPPPSRNKDAESIINQISELDREGTPTFTAQGIQEVNRMARRVALIEKLLAVIEPAERENWIKQMLDNLSSVGQFAHDNPNDKAAAAAMTRLGQLRTQLEASMKGSNLAGYAVYRELGAVYLPKLGEIKNAVNLGKIQEEWHAQLSKFVQTYPNCEDTPDALQQLGIGSEFAGKDGEAQRWYEQIYKNFPEHMLAPKAMGCVRRLRSVNQEMELSGPALGTNAPFDIKQMRGKVVAVYYWASYCKSCPREFAILKQLQTTLASKGVELVCVNLDDSAQEATRFLQSNPVSAVHLFQMAKTGGGLNSPLAIHYGINGLPTIFVVGRDGKVIHRSLQVTDLEDALKKAL